MVTESTLSPVALPLAHTWIAGRGTSSAGDDVIALDDPNTGAPMADARESSIAQVAEAVDAAARTHETGAWRRRALADRVEALRLFADGLDARAERIATLDALSSGVPVRFTRLFAGSLGDTVRRASALALEAGEERALEAGGRDVRLQRVPWGPVALLLPWNAPAAVAVKKMAYALVAGNPVVLKPSPVAPWSIQLVMEAAIEAGIEPGALNVVLGGTAVGSALVDDPRVRVIALTGSTETGRAVARSAASRMARLRLELGSNNPAIVLADADLALTATALADGMTKLNGQWCEAPRRVYVPRSAIGELVDRLREGLGEREAGSSLDERSTYGPLAFRGRLEAVRSAVEALRAESGEVLSVGEMPSAGWFHAPTLVVGADASEGECFGPVLTIQEVADEGEAIARASHGSIGLAGYVFGERDRALRVGERLTAGEVKINGTSLLDLADDSAQSFFGDSGVGGHGDRDVLDFYSGVRVIGEDLLDPPM
ncbi:aldehyde dehydrogenase family protein [Microbacterium trichothecenolyticum]|uniref:Betaine-aldehyde dehydrogenase n=1 Tax=Microbacterium trichothecenolyticum TaxID=69370 RepID=A0ABU0TQS2_MICTR|nr:aldehyde dehydrogenase family protein [Microbacterium trichothecenolyticum]MDQ1122018.1 betaine-aldehyde dehydrogenase [Microbacterium trichothecenolyticum]